MYYDATEANMKIYMVIEVHNMSGAQPKAELVAEDLVEKITKMPALVQPIPMSVNQVTRARVLEIEE